MKNQELLHFFFGFMGVIILAMILPGEIHSALWRIVTFVLMGIYTILLILKVIRYFKTKRIESVDPSENK